MFTSRLSWHGWPTHPALADIMGWKLDASRLQKAHELVGSGWMLPCSFAALMSFLATVELSEDCGTKTVPRSLPVSPEWELVRVPQNGRCFLACLALWAGLADRAWASTLRNNVSMPIDLATGSVDNVRLKIEEACHLDTHHTVCTFHKNSTFVSFFGHTRYIYCSDIARLYNVIHIACIYIYTIHMYKISISV